MKRYFHDEKKKTDLLVQILREILKYPIIKLLVNINSNNNNNMELKIK